MKRSGRHKWRRYKVHQLLISLETTGYRRVPAVSNKVSTLSTDSARNMMLLRDICHSNMRTHSPTLCHSISAELCVWQSPGQMQKSCGPLQTNCGLLNPHYSFFWLRFSLGFRLKSPLHSEFQLCTCVCARPLNLTLTGSRTPERRLFILFILFPDTRQMFLLVPVQKKKRKLIHVLYVNLLLLRLSQQVNMQYINQFSVILIRSH